ncbi:MAG: hypothetical protein LUF35_08820 [Lachnospiraceae bacterium]|nr:hypothetical protein [Lachnospiraceae bacterium]
MTQNEEYEALKEKYQLDLQPERRMIQSVSSAWTFFKTHYTWDDLFSKKSNVDLIQILSLWRGKLLQELSLASKEAENNVRMRFEQMDDADSVQKDSLCGLLRDSYLSEIRVEEKQLEDQLSKMDEQERKIRGNIAASRTIASGARRMGREREQKLADYVAAMENYRIHLLRKHQCESERSLFCFAESLSSETLEKLEDQRRREKEHERQEAEQRHLEEECHRKEERIAAWEWVRELHQYGVLEIRDAATCVICVMGDIPELPKDASPAQMIAFVHTCASGQISILREHRISCPGSIAAVADYLRKDSTCADLCETELEKRKKQEAMITKLQKIMQAS